MKFKNFLGVFSSKETVLSPFSAEEKKFIDDSNLHKQIVIGVVKIKSKLDDISSIGTGQHEFELHDIEEQVQGLKFITKRLRKDGLKASLGSPEYNMMMIGSRYDIKLNVKYIKTEKDLNPVGFTIGAKLSHKLSETLDFYLKELGISLDIVNNEIKKQYGPDYKNIFENKMVPPRVSLSERLYKDKTEYQESLHRFKEKNEPNAQKYMGDITHSKEQSKTVENPNNNKDRKYRL